MWSGDFSKQSFVSVYEWVYEIWCLGGDSWTSHGLLILTMNGCVERKPGTMAVRHNCCKMLLFIFISAEATSFPAENEVTDPGLFQN